MVKITDLLKMFGFERHLTSGGDDWSYYKFHNKYMMDYYYDKGIKNKVFKVSSGSSGSDVNIIIVDEKDIIEMLFLRFKDQLGIIREIKLKMIGL